MTDIGQVINRSSHVCIRATKWGRQAALIMQNEVAGLLQIERRYVNCLCVAIDNGCVKGWILVIGSNRLRCIPVDYHSARKPIEAMLHLVFKIRKRR